MVCDYLGYVSFCDRLGDTYRWRGENVSTIEVENLISAAFQNIIVVAYGVEVEGEEGRCGMAAVSVGEGSNFDIQKMANHLEKNLAVYARPLFVRLTRNIDYTGKKMFMGLLTRYRSLGWFV